jgi:hypothetical protein
MDRSVSTISYVLQQKNLWPYANLCLYCLLGFSEEQLQDVPINAIKAHKEMEIQFHSFLNSVLDRPNGRLSGPQSLSERLREEKSISCSRWKSYL